MEAINGDDEVAPCVGAWIETLWYPDSELKTTVAPCVGAWIETDFPFPIVFWLPGVAPCVGAWIETLIWAD